MKPQIKTDKHRFLKIFSSKLRIKKKRLLSVFICGSLWLIFVLPINAQIISGTVSDQNNAPIQYAEIAVYNQTKIIVQTSSDVHGKFSFDLQNTQNSLLLIKAKGFAGFQKILPGNFSENLKVVLEPYVIREEITISITRTESRLSETPASVVVLNRETVEQTAAQTIDDTLRQVAGFTLFRRASSKTTNPTTQGANLRGISGRGASRTSVLFDGVSLNDAFGGWTYWTRVPKVAVENAEVLRGGASTFYGNSALSGAVNLETSKSGHPVLRFETSAGMQKTFDGSLFTSLSRNGWDFNGALESFTTDGYIPVAENERGAVDSKADSRHNSGFLTFGRRFNENSRIFVRGNLFAERRNNGTVLTDNRTYFRQGVFGADFGNARYGTFNLRASIESQNYDQTFSSISTDRSAESLTRIQRVPSQAKNANLFWSRTFSLHTLSASLETRKVSGFSDETVVSSNRATSLVSAGGREFSNALFAQDFWRVTKKLNINLGGRFDRWREYNAFSVTQNLTGNLGRTTTAFPDRNAHAFSPRAAALYQISDNFSLLGSFTKSFRSPTLNELYRAFRVGNVLTLANENLLAERSRTFETGANYTGLSKRLNLRGNVFLTEVSNPVVGITLSSTPALITRRRQNVGATRSRGVEFDAEFAPRAGLKFSASYLAVSSRVSEFPANTGLVGKFLPQIPRQQLTFQTFYRPQEKFSFSLQGRISASQFEDDQNTLRLRPFFALDAFASYRLQKHTEIFTAIENVFNNRYDIGLTPNRTIAAPLFARVGLRFSL